MRRSPDKDAGLNPEQHAAVHYAGGPLLVLAGAGSGKTRVITQKIAYLIREDRYHPEHIAAVTFTQKAAREMRARCTVLLGQRAADVHISTFHSLGLRLLREERGAARLKRGFSILDPESARVLIAGELVATDAKKSDAVTAAQWKISEWKSALFRPEDIAGEPYGAVYVGYQRQLEATSCLDFDDLIARPVWLLEQDGELRERWQSRLRYLLVDEYQDSNAAQYRLLKALAGPRGAFTVVGDDDQSIYAWRGARPENLHELGSDYPTLKVVMLETNYRSTGTILDAANALIANNAHLYEKTLRSALGEGERIRVWSVEDGDQEAARIAAETLDLVQRKRLPHEQIAILYRGNHQSRRLEKALAEVRVPYKVSGGIAWFDRAEIKDLLAYLRLLANPEDDAAFLRIANIPRRDIGTATLERLGDYARERDVALFSACFEMGLAGALQPRAVEALRRFARMISQLAERAEREPAREVCAALIEATDYRAWLDDQARDERERAKRRESVEEFLTWIGRGGDELTLAERLRQLAVAELAQRDDGDGRGQVQLMTLHAAKGLEFQAVFLTGMEEGLLPHRTSIEDDSIEEERRLAYVGLTRARSHLYLVHAARRRRFGQWETAEPSRFLAELPEELLDWDEPDNEASAERREAAASHHLNAMRALVAD
ncbi:MAG: UvrD-helicase domain-containing protein [Gammaproteobacteria bacterium]